MNLLIPEMQYLEILKGQALDVLIPVSDQETGADVDLEFATVEFNVGAELITTTKDGNVITAPISSAKTIELGVGDQAFQCWVTIAGESTPVALGRLTIKQSTRT